MEEVPESSQQIENLKSRIYDNPLFVEKLVSKAGEGIAIYIPIQQKDMSYRISNEIEGILEKELGSGSDLKYHIAGLPVAEDTFGYEMFRQMGITAPIIGLVIFVLLFVLFRKVTLIIPPMAVTMLSVIWGMGALIGLGFTIHIMSSMIPVFLMPIAVLNSVHILSEFYDKYPLSKDRRIAITEGMGELFSPMLYCSLTTAVGFGSLTLANIPPVRVFGAFIAFGVMAAWLLSITFIPASIMLIREEKLLKGLEKTTSGKSLLERFLPPLGKFAFGQSKVVVASAAILLALGVYGLSKIVVNDNPVKWFNKEHKIRVADRVMNRLFGGTYMAYLVVEGNGKDDIKRPEVMGYVENLQRFLEKKDVVGKTTSVADIVNRVRTVLTGDGRLQSSLQSLSQEEIGQYLFISLMSGDPNDLDNFVDYDYTKADIWVQLKRGDNRDMEGLELAVVNFTKENPPPEGVKISWSGLTYINKVWQDLMVKGMLNAILGGFAAVFILMTILFRSPGLGLISMMPLTFAIILSYGVVGFIGKDYDMPIAVCSSLALGLSIDFAIHFIQRFRKKYRETGDLRASNEFIFEGPARAIARNAMVIVIGFVPLTLATLTPYVTVGAFFASLMTFSALTTLIVLPALMRTVGVRFLGQKQEIR